MVQLAECFDLSNSLLISLPFIKKENGGFVLKVRCFILSWIPGLYGISSSLTPIWNILGTSWSFICGQKIHGSSTIYTSLGLITWRHHLEISRDQQKFIKKPWVYGGASFVDKKSTLITVVFFVHEWCSTIYPGFLINFCCSRDISRWWYHVIKPSEV